MIPRAVLTRIDRKADAGRTAPLRGVVEADDGTEAEAFVKLSAGCDQGASNLAREVIAACLASDLGLPVPQPWIVEVPPEILPAVVDLEIANQLNQSLPVAFGSTVAPGFVVWTPGHRLTDTLRSDAAAALLFDAIIQNPDRRAENPNCLVKGEELCFIDHELAFTHRLALLWSPPWDLGGMRELETPGRHIFVSELKGTLVDWTAIKSRWAGLPDARLQEYAGTIPPEWSAAQADVDAAVQLIADARDNIDGCVAEIGRVLA